MGKRKKSTWKPKKSPDWYRSQAMESALRLSRKPIPPIPSPVLHRDEAGRPDYYEYIKSADWAAKRLEIIGLRGAYCERCDSPKDLQVHHKSYRNLGNEPPEDLEILCRECHKREHGK